MKKAKSFAILALLMVATFTGCNSAINENSLTPQESTYSSVKKNGTTIFIQLPQANSSRTAYTQNDATDYDVSIYLNNNFLERKEGLPGEKISFSVNQNGNYKIKVNAYMDSQLIADAESDVNIDLSKSKVNVNIQMNPKEKTTELDIQITWPDNPVSIEQIPDFVYVEGSTVTGDIKFAPGIFDYYQGSFFPGEDPEHPRTVTVKSFYICRHEVTQKEFFEIMDENPSNFWEDPAEDETQENRPVEMVSWYDAITYCNKRSLKENLTPCYKIADYPDSFWINLKYQDIPSDSYDDLWDTVECDFNANGYRLPTEAEWEYAALGGKNGVNLQDPTDFSGTNSAYLLAEYAWYGPNSDEQTHEVMLLLPNSLGIYDMTGNVFEWCWDNYYTDLDSEIPTQYGINSGYERVRRGGSWYFELDNEFVFYRDYMYPYMRDAPEYTYKNYDVGFRVVRSSK